MNEMLVLLGQAGLVFWVVCAVVAILLLALGFLLGRAGSRNGSLATLQRTLQTTRNDLEQSRRDRNRQVEEYELKLRRMAQEVERLRHERCLSEFPGGQRWVLHTVQRIDATEIPHWLGLVESEDGTGLLPFYTRQNLDGMSAGDAFVVRNGEVIDANQVGALEGPETTVMGAVGSTMFMKAEDTISAMAADVNTLPFLVVTAGDDKGKRFPIDFAQRITIGRREPSTIVLNDNGASRVHAEIYFDGRNFHIKDNQSTNKTYHKGKAITQSVLDLGDTITIGGTDLLFSCKSLEVMDQDRGAAIEAFEKLLKLVPTFVPALRGLAFLLERDVAGRERAQAIWDKLTQLEGTPR